MEGREDNINIWVIYKEIKDFRKDNTQQSKYIKNYVFVHAEHCMFFLHVISLNMICPRSCTL